MSAKTCAGMATLVLLLAGIDVQAGRTELDFDVALPGRKAPVEVVLRRNPFQGTTQEPDKAAVPLIDRDDPATKLPSLLAPRIHSVIRKPRSLVLIAGTVFQPGDELRVGGEPVLPQHRVVLKSVEDERLVVTLTSLDPQHPGQVDSFVGLAASMRRSE